MRTLGCPWIPTFFEAGETADSTPETQRAKDAWLFVLRAAQTSRVVLRIFSNETGGDEPTRAARYTLAQRRVEALRAYFIRSGVAPDRVMYHVDLSDSGFAPEGWRGSWIYPEFYRRGREVENIVPPGSVC